MVWARPLSSSEGNTTAYNDILNNYVLSTMWQQFGEAPFLLQHDNAPVHKAMSIQKWFVEISVEELNWPAHSPDLTNAVVAQWRQVPTAMLQHIVESLPRRLEAVIAAKGGQKQKC